MKKPRLTILSRNVAESLGYGLVSLLSFIVVTCASATKGPATVSERRAAAAPAPASPGHAPSAVPITSARGPATSTAPPGAPAPARLERLHSALRKLSEKHADPVRVLFLGDSHAAADFWPDAIRQALQEKYGKGGPGFIHLGLGVYRHSGVKVTRAGKWRVLPKQPSLWMRQEDGVFGLGGMRTVGEASDSSVTVELVKDAVAKQAHWDLAFRLPTDRARFRFSTGKETKLVDATTAAVGALSHVEFRTKPDATVVIDQLLGDAELFGIIVESTEPGAVVDTLGVNGARIGTPLAWDAGAWIEVAQRRKPSLFVLEYGTNEAGDQVAPFRYAPEFAEMVARVRKAAPDADCLIIGPTDREGPDWTTLPRVVEIEAVEREAADRLGCAYFSALAAMGGEGSLKRWAAEAPPRAAPDRVHLTPRGYMDLGAATASFLLGN
jgi:lysophospholipase L1-like esterase